MAAAAEHMAELSHTRKGHPMWCGGITKKHHKLIWRRLRKIAVVAHTRLFPECCRFWDVLCTIKGEAGNVKENCRQNIKKKISPRLNLTQSVLTGLVSCFTWIALHAMITK